MNKIIKTFLVLNIFLLPSIKAQTISDNLKVLEPLLNKTWVGELKAPDGSEAYETTQTYSVLWDGTVVKFTGSTPELNANSEGYFYWDRQEQKVAVIIINNKGIYQKGFVTVEDGKLTSCGTISFPERTFDFKNIFEFTNDGKLIDRWFQNAFGSWMAGHVIKFKVSRQEKD